MTMSDETLVCCGRPLAGLARCPFCGKPRTAPEPATSEDELREIARRLYAAMETATAGKEPPHSFEVSIESDRDRWMGFAGEALRMCKAAEEKGRREAFDEVFAKAHQYYASSATGFTVYDMMVWAARHRDACGPAKATGDHAADAVAYSCKPGDPEKAPRNMSVREAARRRFALGGPDCQALEGAITLTERERDEAREALDLAEKERDHLRAENIRLVKERDGLSADLVDLSELDRLRVENAKLAASWRCFHCGDVFVDEVKAREHFGKYEVSTPICAEDVRKFRDMEEELARYRAEDSDKDREVLKLRADHAAALRRAEEDGYASGLRNYTKVEQERDELRAKLAKAEHNSQYWLDAGTRRQEELSKAQAEIERLTRELEEAKAKIERMRASHAELSDDHVELEEKLVEAQQEIGRLSRELEEARKPSQPPAQPAPVTAELDAQAKRFTLEELCETAARRLKAAALLDQAAAVEAATATLKARVAELEAGAMELKELARGTMGPDEASSRDRLERALGMAVHDKNVFQREAYEKDKRISERDKQIADLDERLANVCTERNEKDKFVSELRSRLKEVEKERDAKGKRIAELTCSNENFEKAYESARKERDANAQAVRDANRGRAELRAYLQKIFDVAEIGVPDREEGMRRIVDLLQRNAQAAREMEAKLRGLAEHCSLVERERDGFRRDLNIMRATETEGVWFWQGKGEDYPETLSCPVVMSVETARGMESTIEDQKRRLDSARAGLQQALAVIGDGR